MVIQEAVVAGWSRWQEGWSILTLEHSVTRYLNLRIS